MTANKTPNTAGRDKDASGAVKRTSRNRDPLVANALRNAYEEALGEDVPQEFIDLLSKLS